MNVFFAGLVHVCEVSVYFLQYRRQPGVLLHHPHRGAVQQSERKPQTGHQGQGACMTETLDFIFYSDQQDFYLWSTSEKKEKGVFETSRGIVG